MRARRCLLFLALAISAGCTAPAPVPANALDNRVWDAHAERFIGEDELVQRLQHVRFRLLGEMHDHPDHHRLRAALIGKLGAPTEIYFEQFDREHDAALREAQSAGADADGMARAGQLDTAWQWPLYRPLVAAALAAKYPVRAANLSAAGARRIAKAGALGPEDAALDGALSGADWPAARETALRAEILDAHCGALPERVAPGMALSQRARDAAIALALSGADSSAVLIAGNGHIRRDLGVPLYLPRGSTVLSVGFLETRGAETDPRAYVRGVTHEAAYDYIWFTAPHPRADPCETLRNRPAAAAR